MRKTVGWSMAAVGLAAVIGVPGVALASSTEVTPEPVPSVQGEGPPEWAPDECQELWDSEEMEAWREEHRAEMREHRGEMRQHHADTGNGEMHRHGPGAGNGPAGGRMWDSASS